MFRKLVGLLALCLISCNALASPQRIVSLTPHITELLFAIGAGPQVVATGVASDWPTAVKKPEYQSGTVAGHSARPRGGLGWLPAIDGRADTRAWYSRAGNQLSSAWRPTTGSAYSGPTDWA